MINNSNDITLAHAAIENELAFSCEDTGGAAWMRAFSDRVNDLILHDFNGLVLILYRLDISEAKLRKLLKDQITGETTSAADIICGLIIERQIQKIKTRREFPRDENISEDEKW